MSIYIDMWHSDLLCVCSPDLCGFPDYSSVWLSKNSTQTCVIILPVVTVTLLYLATFFFNLQILYISKFNLTLLKNTPHYHGRQQLRPTCTVSTT